MQGKITASIVIYKSNISMLKKAVESFLNSTENSILYLIDNSPTNECEQLFNHSRIRYTFNNKNIGFGAGHNIALKEVLKDTSKNSLYPSLSEKENGMGPVKNKIFRDALNNNPSSLHNPGKVEVETNDTPTYHIVLNPDVYFEPVAMEKLFHYMEANPEVGLIMPKVLYPDGQLQPLCRLLPSPLTLFSRRFLQFNQQWLNRLNHLYEMHFSGYDKIMDVPFLSGCFMFLRLDALREVGLFDERIFLYTEDTDMTRRIHQRYRTLFFPEATIYHYNQRGSYRSTTILIHHIFSAITYFNKWGWFADSERKMINQRILLNFSQ